MKVETMKSLSTLVGWQLPCAISVCGCSLVLAPSSLTSGSDGGLALDASAEVEGGTLPADGGDRGDANAPDANTTSDAGDGAPGPGPFCTALSPQPGFCVDFDSPPYNTSDWDKAFPISSSAALSLPNAARFSIAGAGASMIAWRRSSVFTRMRQSFLEPACTLFD